MIFQGGGSGPPVPLLDPHLIPQYAFGNEEMWDRMYHAPETPETDYITPKQNLSIRKLQVVFLYLSGLQRV